MLSKKYRLSRKQITLIHKKGRRHNADQISLKFLPNTLGFGRFAVNVPTSAYKKATDRNRLRRVVYQEIGKSSLNQPFDFLISIYRRESEENILKKVKEILSKIR